MRLAVVYRCAARCEALFNADSDGVVECLPITTPKTNINTRSKKMTTTERIKVGIVRNKPRRSGGGGGGGGIGGVSGIGTGGGGSACTGAVAATLPLAASLK